MKKIGRPQKSAKDRRSFDVHVKLTRIEMAELKLQAHRALIPLATWARTKLLEAARAS